MQLLLLGYIDDWYNYYIDALERGILNNRAQDLEIVICSGGGDVMKGLELSTMIKTHQGKTTAIMCGITASIATVIAESANEIHMDVNGLCMIHNASGMVMGEADDMRESADVLDKISAQILGFYLERIAKNSKLIDGSIEKTTAFLKKAMDAETFYTAQQCLDLGLIDKIVNCNVPTPTEAPQMGEDIAMQIQKAYPTVQNKFPKFYNQFKQMATPEKIDETPDKKSAFTALLASFGTLMNSFKSLFVTNEATPEAIALPETAAEVVTPEAELIPIPEPITNTDETMEIDKLTDEQLALAVAEQQKRNAALEAAKTANDEITAKLAKLESENKALKDAQFQNNNPATPAAKGNEVAKSGVSRGVEKLQNMYSNRTWDGIN